MPRCCKQLPTTVAASACSKNSKDSFRMMDWIWFVSLIRLSVKIMKLHFIAAYYNTLMLSTPTENMLTCDSSLTHQLDVPQSQCTTVGDRAFAVAGARLWNSLPPDIVACDTVTVPPWIENILFTQSYSSIAPQFVLTCGFTSGPLGLHFDHVRNTLMWKRVRSDVTELNWTDTV